MQSMLTRHQAGNVAELARHGWRGSVTRTKPLFIIVASLTLLVGLVPAASAETYGDGQFVEVGTNGSSATGEFVSVSDTGTAESSCHSISIGCVTGVAVSGTGNTNGAVAVSGTGNAGWDESFLGRPSVAVSGTGTAKASQLAVSGTGDADQRTINGCSDSPTALFDGQAVSGIGNAEGCRTADGMLTWIDTPNGPVAVGPAVETFSAFARAVVAGVEGVVGEASYPIVQTVHDVEEAIPSPPPVPDPTTIDPTDPRLITGLGQGGGTYDSGCSDNASCSGLHAVRRHRIPIQYYHPEYSFSYYHGIFVGTYLAPTTASSNGMSYDAFHMFTTLTGDWAGICGINNYAEEGGGNEAFYDMAPKGSQDVGSGQNMSIGISVGPFSFGTSWTSYSGRVRGDYNPGSAKATGSWTYRKNKCPRDGDSASMASGASYEWPRGVGRSYEVGTLFTWQLR